MDSSSPASSPRLPESLTQGWADRLLEQLVGFAIQCAACVDQGVHVEWPPLTRRALPEAVEVEQEERAVRAHAERRRRQAQDAVGRDGEANARPVAHDQMLVLASPHGKRGLGKLDLAPFG